MASTVLYLSEDRVRQLFSWESTFDAIKEAITSESEGKAIQSPRSFTQVPNKGVLLTMPGYLQNSKYNSLGCKLVTSFLGNRTLASPLPTILANILLFDVETGQLKCIVSGTEITTCRTAAASVVATKYLHFRSPGKKAQILAILGAGTQGRIHAIAFQHFFNFDEVRIWNRTKDRAEKLVSELKGICKGLIVCCESAEECVRNADVVVTATRATSPILKRQWVKSDVHINAVGAGETHHSELDEAVYRDALIYVDHWEGAQHELKGLQDMGGVKLKATVGAVILGKESTPPGDRLTVFHSLGMAVEDCAMARLMYDRHLNE